MKRIVFLLCIIMAVSLSTPFKAEETISVEREIIEGVERLVIEGTAHHPFRIVRGDDNNHYISRGIQSGDDHHVVYGYAILERTSSFSDGFIIVLDNSGTIVAEEIIDYDHLEEVMDVQIGDEALYVHLRQSIDNRPENVIHRKDFLLRVTETIDILHEDDEGIQRVLYERQGLYFSKSTQGAYEHAYHVHEGLLEEGEIHGLEDKGQYRGTLELHSLCETSMFEEAAFERSLVIDYPGHYTIRCDETDYAFTLHPEIEGVRLHEQSTAPVSITVSGGRVWLNDDLYVNGTLVNEPGHYTLKTEGANGYEESAYFTLESGLEGVEEGGVYSGVKTVFFSGEGYLNETPISSGHSFEESGPYTLKILGNADYEERITFEILPGPTPPIRNLLRFEILLAAGGIIMTSGLVFLFLRKR